MISQPVIDYMQDNDPLRPNMGLLEKMTPKQLLDVVKINADDAGLDIKKELIDLIVRIAKKQRKKQ